MLKIESLNREVEMIQKTRKHTRLINAELYNGISVSVDITNPSNVNINDIPMLNVEASNELSVKLLFGLSDEEMNNLSDEDYGILFAESKKK